MELIYKLSQVHPTASALWKLAAKCSVLAFYGAMGSGKTTLIHAMADIKKVKDVVGSPSFSIINEYVYDEEGVEKKLFHIDLYRLKDEVEAMSAGVSDCLSSGHICLLEWPEKAPSLIPEHSFRIKIAVIDQETRQLQIGNN